MTSRKNFRLIAIAVVDAVVVCIILNIILCCTHNFFSIRNPVAELYFVDKSAFFTTSGGSFTINLVSRWKQGCGLATSDLHNRGGAAEVRRPSNLSLA